MIGTSRAVDLDDRIVDVEPRSAASTCSAVEHSRAVGVAQHGGEFGGGHGAYVGADFALDAAVGGNALEYDAGVVVGGIQRSVTGRPECTPTPETAMWSRSVVCLAPFIEPVSAGSLANRAVPSLAPTRAYFCLHSATNREVGRQPPGLKSPFRS